MVNRPEQQFQIELVRALRTLLPPGWIVAHLANGFKRTSVEAAIAKAMGVVAGMPDLILIGPGKIIFIECKAPPKRLRSGKLSDGGSLSQAQLAVIEQLATMGWPVLVVCEIDKALAALTKLGVPIRGRAM